jgi:hypothetical protein
MIYVIFVDDRYEIATAVLDRLALPHMHIIRSLAINELLRLDDIIAEGRNVKKGIGHLYQYLRYLRMKRYLRMPRLPLKREAFFN